ncbi:uncharacterized protein VP01_730g6 [Puccinia sorghi]|uniref:CCHC-type domain-containing protein n=1 Tax=Puccinia sorghi TaxID=27349 RepID=A0A0L6UF51_9BASI|nr:uncharacterized protein VP01_730g6 [Puccinia sorghi]
MPTTRMQSAKAVEKSPENFVAENPALSKFLSNPNSYVSYINPQLLSDGSNITQWIDALSDLAHLLFGIKNFFEDENNFQLLDSLMDRSVLHVIKSSIALDVRPIVKDADSALDAFQTLKKNFHKSTRAKQLELINSLIHLDNNLSAAHFNKFFSIISQLSSLGVSFSPVAEGLLLQALTSPPAGTTRTQINNLIMAAAEKSDELGARDIQVIYNSVQSDSVDGVGTEENPFKINRIGYMGRGGGIGGAGRGFEVSGRGSGMVGNGRGGRFINANDLCHYCRQRGHWKFDCPHKVGTQVQSGGGRGSFNKPEVPHAPAIRVAAADATGIVDTGATNHVSGDLSLLSNLRPLRQNILLKLASLNGTVAATHAGSIRISSTHSTTQLDNVLYCPDIRGTLISLGQLLDDGFKVMFDNGAMLITDDDSGAVLVAHLKDRSWRISFSSPLANPVSSSMPAVLKLSGDWQSSLQWHNRLGHASDRVIKEYLRRFVPSFNIKSWVPFFCETCAVAKSERRRAALKSEIPSKAKGDLVVSDVLGPVDPADIFGNQAEVETKLQHALTIIKTQSAAQFIDYGSKPPLPVNSHNPGKDLLNCGTGGRWRVWRN